MKLLIVAGGGGHFAAALSVIDILPKDMDLLVVGREHAFEGEDTKSFEYRTTKARGIPFAPLVSGRLQRAFTRHTISSLAKIPNGLKDARKILQDFRPDVVVSFGGYIAVPIVVAASLMKIPVVLHEQTFQAGLANKISARFARIICTSWPGSEAFFPKQKIVLTGNPVRKEIICVLGTSDTQAKKDMENVLKVSREDLPILYITGGSGGSHILNVAVRDALADLLERYIVVHQTGDSSLFNDFDALAQRLNDIPSDRQQRYLLRKFLTPEEVALVMDGADLVVSRSGVNTVTELIFLQKKALLIPLVSGQKGEQLTNARFLQKIGLADILPQDRLDPQTLLAHIEKVLHNETVQGKTSAMLQDQIREAPKKILDQILHVYQQTTAKKESERK